MALFSDRVDNVRAEFGAVSDELNLVNRGPCLRVERVLDGDLGAQGLPRPAAKAAKQARAIRAGCLALDQRGILARDFRGARCAEKQGVRSDAFHDLGDSHGFLEVGTAAALASVHVVGGAEHDELGVDHDVILS